MLLLSHCLSEFMVYCYYHVYSFFFLSFVLFRFVIVVVIMCLCLVLFTSSFFIIRSFFLFFLFLFFLLFLCCYSRHLLLLLPPFSFSLLLSPCSSLGNHLPAGPSRLLREKKYVFSALDGHVLLLELGRCWLVLSPLATGAPSVVTVAVAVDVPSAVMVVFVPTRSTALLSWRGELNTGVALGSWRFVMGDRPSRL